MKLIASRGDLRFSPLRAPNPSKGTPPRCYWSPISLAFIHVNVVKDTVHTTTLAHLAVRAGRIIIELIDSVRKHDSPACVSISLNSHVALLRHDK